jgi:hypothetical protein
VFTSKGVESGLLDKMTKFSFVPFLTRVSKPFEMSLHLMPLNHVVWELLI